MEKGYVQVYTGEGKGKTTAAMGLIVRALGAGLKVLFMQFMKGSEYSEIKFLRHVSSAAQLEIKQYGTGSFITGKADLEQIAAGAKGLREATTALQSGQYDLVVLDEANMAVYFGLFSVDDLIRTIQSRAPGVEVIITGRRADPKLIDIADLVTEMREIKHYYTQGVMARPGIEM
ncbi:MAG TPA: cob(I)yrinic acid a,c-diamide adenosyltransferase [Firmicutes bacterium]|jgi:cob(I)alamin adenosyltransferase|nr:cob(I)yrinic acid a,c-diamide adenosyltransferase [Bacillota bacterium]